MADAFSFLIELTDKVSAPAKNMSKSIDQISGQMESLGVESEAGAEAIGVLGASFAAVAVLAVGAAVAIGAVLYKGAGLSIAASDFKGDALDALEALTGSAEEAKATFDEVSKLSDELAIPREVALQKTNALLIAGVKDLNQVHRSIEAVADLQQAGNDKAAKKLQKAVEEAAAKGDFKQIDKLLDGIDKKVGGLARKQTKDLDRQVAKLHENFFKLFQDVKTDKFLGALDDTLSVFKENSEVAKTLKWVVEAIFNGLFDAAAKALPYIKNFIYDLVIVGLKWYVSMKPVIESFDKLFGSVDGGAVLKFILDAIVFSVQLLGTNIKSMSEDFLSFWNTATTVFNAVQAGAASVASFMGQIVTEIKNLFSGGDSITAAFVDGLIQGITGGVGRAVEAAKGLAKGALDGIKGTLGIASPSKVMAEMGQHTATGFGEGLDKGAGKVETAMTDMVAPPQAETTAKAAKGGGSIDVGGITVNITGAGDAQSIKTMFAHEMASVFEQLALQMGTA